LHKIAERATREGFTRSTFRFNALMTPMRANIVLRDLVNGLRKLVM
jgi:hypothetical protein